MTVNTNRSCSKNLLIGEHVVGGEEEINLLGVFDVVRFIRIWLDSANIFLLAAQSNDSGRLREHFGACFLDRGNLTKEK